MQTTAEKIILDACCGARMFHFDKQNQAVLFMDNRHEVHKISDHHKPLHVNPDFLADFRQMPFVDESFYHVIFDPPHLLKGTEAAWLIKKYGKLPKAWQPIIKDGFNECWRVLKPNGTLVFKWSEYNIKVNEIIQCIGREPLYGHKSGKQQKTHWLVFVKLPPAER